MKRFSLILILLMAFSVSLFAGDLDKPSTARGNIISGSEISDLYSTVIGDSTFDNIKLNGVKTYRALVTQSSTDAPVATVLENTLGDTVDFTRTGTGAYVLALDSCFIANKTFLYVGCTNGALVSTSEGASLAWYNADSLLLYTADTPGSSLADSLMTKTPVEILVYP